MITHPYEPAFTIGVVSRKFGITPETIRLYERKGLVLPHRTPSGHRLFSASDMEWIGYIRKYMTDQKISLAGIRRLVSLLPCWEISSFSQSDCVNCAAHSNNDSPCWHLSQKNKVCENANCRDCTVYRHATQAVNLKKYFELVPK